MGDSDSSASSNNQQDIQLLESNNVVKPNKTLNGDQTPNNGYIYPGKTMHVMTPGPKKYQSVKKSPDKEPKFVPYEPYKAAVRSIVPELSQPSVAVFKRRLSTASNCSKISNVIDDKEDVITTLNLEKQVKHLFSLAHNSNYSPNSMFTYANC